MNLRVIYQENIDNYNRYNGFWTPWTGLVLAVVSIWQWLRGKKCN